MSLSPLAVGSRSCTLTLLQSLQENGFALNEGFAHFISARAVQSQTPSACTYTYYKEFREDDGGTSKPPVAKPCVAQIKWAFNHCAVAGNTVEWDWLNFFWAINTDGSSAISIDQIGTMYRTWCGSGNCTTQTVNFANLSSTTVVNTLPNSAMRTLFINSGPAFGVNY
ncbi:hypothetical protein BH09MYX1_BH09MYX1_24600 [soil metagenome]